MSLPESMKAPLKHLIVSHEDFRRFPYVDTENNITIGIGYNISVRGLPDTWINHQYDEDVEFFYKSLKADFYWFSELNEARQCALIDMCFMGYQKFKGFVRLIEALRIHDYNLAFQEVLSSKWALQTKGRASQIANIILKGKL
jgi:GH24 family phage-related lysozyme (muramidase)